MLVGGGGVQEGRELPSIDKSVPPVGLELAIAVGCPLERIAETLPHVGVSDKPILRFSAGEDRDRISD